MMASTFWRQFRLGLTFPVFLASLAVPGVSSASSEAAVFLTSGQLKVQIDQIAAAHPDKVKVLDIGQTLNNSHLYVLQIGTGKPNTPAVLALFGQHADEHEGTNLALGLTRWLVDKAENYEAIANELNKVTIYIAPMINPDGMDYDLRDPDDHPGWRKNRSPQENAEFGVDLNRNWGAFWDAPTGSKSLSARIKDSADPNYRGSRPFSEKETQALRGFVLSHSNIRMFVDYHTGSANFMQGAVLLPYSYGGQAVPSAAKLCAEQLPDQFASAISNREDSRKPFRAVQANRMNALAVEQSPALLKPVMWAATPTSNASSGTAIDWTASNGLCSMGVEISLRNPQSGRQLESRLIEDQSHGLLLLLESLTAKPEREKNGG
jgi:hypothetical protein